MAILTWLAEHNLLWMISLLAVSGPVLALIARGRKPTARR